jgi:hypothetical protein
VVPQFWDGGECARAVVPPAEEAWCGCHGENGEDVRERRVKELEAIGDGMGSIKVFPTDGRCSGSYVQRTVDR